MFKDGEIRKTMKKMRLRKLFDPLKTPGNDYRIRVNSKRLFTSKQVKFFPFNLRRVADINSVVIRKNHYFWNNLLQKIIDPPLL